MLFFIVVVTVIIAYFEILDGQSGHELGLNNKEEKLEKPFFWMGMCMHVVDVDTIKKE